MARDGTPFVCAAAHLIDGHKVDKADRMTIKTNIPTKKKEEASCFWSKWRIGGCC